MYYSVADGQFFLKKRKGTTCVHFSHTVWWLAFLDNKLWHYLRWSVQQLHHSFEDLQFYLKKRKSTTLVTHSVVTLSFLDIKLTPVGVVFCAAMTPFCKCWISSVLFPEMKSYHTCCTPCGNLIIPRHQTLELLGVVVCAEVALFSWTFQFYLKKRKGTTFVAHNVGTLSFLDIKLWYCVVWFLCKNCIIGSVWRNTKIC